MDIEFRGRYEKSQYLKAIRLAGTPSKWSTLWRIFLFLLMTGLTIAYAVTAGQDGGFDGFRLTRILRYLVMIVFLAGIIFMPFVNIYCTANRLWKDPLIRREISGYVSTQGITYGTTLTAWNDFAFKFITDDLVVLLTADRVISTLPRNFFKTESDWQNFRRMVEYYVLVAK